MNDLIISCTGLEKTYRSSAEELRVLRGLDFEVERGSRVAIMGASGSGKSTLLSVLGGLDRPSGGKVSVGGWDLANLPERRLPEFRAGVVGFVFQFHYLLKDFTALENVALPAYMRSASRRAATERAEGLLDDLGLGQRLAHFPSQLSGGERQRVAVARALVNSPGLILADEPTGNLDAAGAQLLRELLFDLGPRYGTTLVLATHDSGLAGGADRRYVLSDGVLGPA